MEPVRILLLTDDQTRRHRWRELLELDDSRFAVTSDGTMDSVDLVISDRPIAGDWLARHASQFNHDEIGIVAVGCSDSGDVHLPADCSERELRLACKLLAQTVELRRERNALARLAYTDPLTDLPNRRAWECELSIRFEAAVKEKQPFCLAVLDLDNFKLLNDREGFLAGDEVLRNTGKRLSEQVLTDREYAARFGGDEFGFVVSGLSRENALARVEQIRAFLCCPLDDHAGNELTASAGAVYALSLSNSNWRELFCLADAALRRAKAGGRNRLAHS